MKWTPNVKRLILWRMSHLAIPPGGGIFDGIKAIMTPGLMAKHAREAEAWVTDALAKVRAAPDNPYPDDEAIAAELLRCIEMSKNELKKLKGSTK